MPDQLEHQLNATYQLGISSGWEHTASYLHRQAAEAFLRDDEMLAHILKEHAKLRRDAAGRRARGT